MIMHTFYCTITLLLTFTTTVARAHEEQTTDIGYDQLFVTHNESFSQVCQDSNFPKYIKGTFIIPSLGQFEKGGVTFQGLLDGYGKLSRFSVSNGNICFASRMMDTGFYNVSNQMDSIAPSMLFMNTIPTRNFSGIRNLQGPNDNVFVNTYALDNHFRCVTDSQVELEFDPKTLKMNGPKMKWQDKTDHGIPLGSAHGLPEVNIDGTSTGCRINVHPQVGYLQIKHDISVLRICPNAPYTRNILATVDLPFMPYFHSWGLTSNYAVLPMMKFTVDMIKVMEGQTLSEAFTPEDLKNPNTDIYVVPLDNSTGTKPVKVVLPNEHVFFTHTMNSYQVDDETLIMDIIAWGTNPFSSDAAALSLYRNKTTRDSLALRGIPKRLTINITSGTAATTIMKGFAKGEIMGPTNTDFTKINPHYHTRKYCIFYAVQWNSNGNPSHPELNSYATMAIIKYNVCTGVSSFWRGPSNNFYPSEPTFVPTNKVYHPDDAEDDGTLVFTVLNGETKMSSFLAVDAKTMTVLSNVTLPDTIGFTTHGEFFEGLLVD